MEHFWPLASPHTLRSTPNNADGPPHLSTKHRVMLHMTQMMILMHRRHWVQAREHGLYLRAVKIGRKVYSLKVQVSKEDG